MTDGQPFRIFSPLENAHEFAERTESTGFPPFSGSSESPTASDSCRERDFDRIAGAAEPRTVEITLGQMVPLLMDAAQKNRVWLSDFADESVRIDADLYEVLLAYQRLRDRHAA